ncbi:MAG: Lrp/AsnC ligand binding domain-containing protein [Thaumarchaeota archaeon]|nr:Lrp/AsnC ligand binding domain-containing protein [Nitrososphaerota archaeon]MBI3022880.1 Lrp/AsnC ligand binding domain-containing protein [Nitrososphaerota archaeon]
MALNACILIKTTPVQTADVRQKIKRLKGVRKVFIAYGRFDLVAFVEASEYPTIRRLTGTINAVEGVRSTETLVEA